MPFFSLPTWIGVLSLVPISCLVLRDVEAVADGTHSAQVDTIFREWDSNDRPGFVVGIVRHGEVLHQRGYGMANLDESVPIDSRSVFGVISLSKSFTTVCVAIAMDQGLFSPDDAIRT